MAPLRSSAWLAARSSLGSKTTRRWATSALVLGLLAGATSACSTHHWATVKTSDLAPPPAPVLHDARLVVDLSRVSDTTDCVVYEDYSPLCFHNLRASLERSLLRTTWTSFPDVVLGNATEVRPGDYVLEVEVNLDALPPDLSGPGWSAGARSRFRLVRDGKVLTEETLSSRSRTDFAYGAPLGTGASEVVDATVLHIAQRIAEVPEEHPKDERVAVLPTVASRLVVGPKGTLPSESKSHLAKTTESPRAETPAPADAVEQSPTSGDLAAANEPAEPAPLAP